LTVIPNTYIIISAVIRDDVITTSPNHNPK